MRENEKIKAGCIILAATVMIGLTACRNADTVSQAPKDNERLVEQAHENEGNENVVSSAERNVSERYTYSYENEDKTFRLTADADIVLPEAEAVPMYRVEECGYSQELVTKVYDYFFPDGETYRYEGNELTKDKCQEMIEEQQKLIDAVPDRDDLSEEGKEALLQQLQGRLERLQDRYDDLPEEASATAVKVDSTLQEEPDSTDYGKVLGLYAEGKDGELWVTSSDPDAGGWSHLDFYKKGGYSYTFGEDEPIDSEHVDAAVVQEIGISCEEAQKISDDFFRQIGIEANVCASFARIGVAEEMNLMAGTDNVMENHHTAYRFVYMRAKNGVPFGTTSANLTPEHAELDDRIWCYERISVFVEKGGIVRVNWEFPLTVTEIVSDSADLISYEDAAAVFEEIMPLMYGEKLKENTDTFQWNFNVNVDRIELCLMRVRDADKSKRTGLLTPAWVFYGSEISTARSYDAGTGEWIDIESQQTAPWIALAVNAVDGSVIDLVEGY